MKFKTILDLKQKIDDLYDLLEELELEFLHLIDDSLWTVDLESKPCFTRDYDVKFITDVRLTKKYVIRFSEDFGLSLKDFQELEDGYMYLFEVEKDIMKNISMLEE